MSILHTKLLFYLKDILYEKSAVTVLSIKSTKYFVVFISPCSVSLFHFFIHNDTPTYVYLMCSHSILSVSKSGAYTDQIASLLDNGKLSQLTYFV